MFECSTKTDIATSPILPLSCTLIMKTSKRKQSERGIASSSHRSTPVEKSVYAASNENPTSQVDDNWRAGLHFLRIRNKAALARVIYKRTANTENLNKSTREKVTRALLDAKRFEERCYTEATNEHDYRTRFSMYFQSVPNIPDTIQAAVVATSYILSKDQLLPLLSEESSSEAFRLNLWILVETLSGVDAFTRVQSWPSFEFLLEFIGCHAKTIHAVLLAIIGSHANTMYALNQQLQLQQLQQPQQYQPSSFLYLKVLLHSIGRINRIIILDPPPQQQQGPSEIQKEMHDEVLAFLDQIQ